MFDLNIYPILLRIADKILFEVKRPLETFTKHDIVHDLFISDEQIGIKGCNVHIYSWIYKERRAAPKLSTPLLFLDAYVCSNCKELLPVGAFYVVNDFRDGIRTYISSYCKWCCADKNKQYQQCDTYLSKRNERQRSYYYDNRRKINSSRAEKLRALPKEDQKKIHKEKWIRQKAKRIKDKLEKGEELRTRHKKEYDWGEIDPKIHLALVNGDKVADISNAIGVPKTTLYDRIKLLKTIQYENRG